YRWWQSAPWIGLLLCGESVAVASRQHSANWAALLYHAGSWKATLWRYGEGAMKTIGLLGGMSWESSAEYYRLVNEQVKARLGGLHSARCVLFSVDFAEIERLQQQGDWDTAGEVLAQAAYQLEQAVGEPPGLSSPT